MITLILSLFNDSIPTEEHGVKQKYNTELWPD
jgi:hypothetical protein